MALRKRDSQQGSTPQRLPSTGHFQVYALRNAGDGTIAFVGRRRASDHEVSDVHDFAELEARRRSAEDGNTLELIILADELTDDAEARRIEEAVVRAYRTVRLTPQRSAAGTEVPAMGWEPPSERPGVIHSEDVFAVDGPFGSEDPVPLAGFLDGDHRQRLEELILRQHQEIAELNDTVQRVRAVRDLHVWAGAGGGAADRGLIRVADIDRALGSDV